MVTRMQAIGAAVAALLAGTAMVEARQAAPAIRPIPVPRMPIPVAALLPQTQAVLDAAVAAGKVPGAVVAIGSGDGPTLFVTSGRIADAADAAPAGPDSLWRVYSMTKPLTATAAMILIEEGKLKLDERLATYLPAYAHLRVLTDPAKSLDSRPATRPITIRELLTHTAGLGYSIMPPPMLAHEYERQGIVPAALDARTEADRKSVV